MSWKPTVREAWSLLDEAGVPAWVLRHAGCVRDLAVAMARRAPDGTADPALVEVGAILHDVGRAVTQDVRHASLGSAWLADRDVEPAIVQVVDRHTGAGIDAAGAAALGLPVRDYTPRSLEERIVAHADNLYSGDKRLDLHQVQAKYVAKGLEDAGARILELHRALCDELGVDLERLARLTGLEGPTDGATAASDP
ncbi:MAG: HDIG domain-containing metalloprotein [Thermoplasmatota archaeon]